MKFKFIFYLLFLASCLSIAKAQTTALWTFDEQQGMYPSSVISDVSESDYPLVIGPGGMIVKGKFGNAIEAASQPKVKYPVTSDVNFGLAPVKAKPGRKIPPMTWANAEFCALMTGGEKHLRNEVGFANAAETKLNIGDFDWTVEFWFEPGVRKNNDGVIFEIGTGPRGENNIVTRLILSKDLRSFQLINQPGDIKLKIPTEMKSGWHHYAFVYSSSDKRINHFADGKLLSSQMNVKFRSLPRGDESYMCIGTDGLWNRPMQGKLDELRFSQGEIYTADFNVPGSFSDLYKGEDKIELKAGPPLLFGDKKEITVPVKLLNRKYVFIDDALVDSMKDITFNVNPPRYADRVISDIQGTFRKHLNVVQDESGNIRMYMGVEDDYLGVLVSKDGIHFEAPDLGADHKGKKNIAIAEPCAMGMTFIDPNAPPEEKWKYVSDFNRRGIYLFTSPDGFHFKRIKTAVLPFRGGSQSNIFYDDQKQIYVSYHRTDLWATPNGGTERSEVMTLAKDIKRPWPFKPLTQLQQIEISKHERVHDFFPWYMDNGPLTPGGFGFEYPRIFAPIDTLDPVGTDIYVPKAVKYEYAPDTYLAFPVMYFHYENIDLPARAALADKSREMGGGVTDMQLETSRDGVHWKRYARPSYIPIGTYDGDEIKQAYIAEGLVKRGDEIWQYFFGDERYHSSSGSGKSKRGVYRVVQRLDGFVSADSPYGREAELVTKPLVFEGNRLVLNINTSGTGYAQVGFEDENGKAIEGFSADDCVYINDNSVAHEVEWLNKGKDVSSLQGKTVRVVFRMRGAKLYAMQFVNK